MSKYIFLFVVLLSACSAGSLSGSQYHEGRPVEHPSVFVFNGHTLENVTPPYDRSVLPLVSPNLYGVIFFVKDGYYPEVSIFKGKDAPPLRQIPLTRKLENSGSGVLTGVFYMPIAGGKIHSQGGIYKLVRSGGVTLMTGSKLYTAHADERGVFMVVLPQGEYLLIANGKEIDKVLIQSGRTTIKNIQKGLVLRD